ncbi:hypothetical protein [Ruminococcus albus]|uniref:Conserved domain protein n=1 Tax=Ruminococcus albus 8 TaxID=246199 RepID=E9SBH1_RUMAL|nr:hypothetical protein [Ruminococcus albus]EGC03372.1 conserved domain protein [Ruminococcus albus 8]MCC3352044.1 hypothetical protein [Ruminococcus albus 8]
MRISDLHFIDETELAYSAITPCLFKDKTEENADEYNNFVRTLIKNASDTDDFVTCYLNEAAALKYNYYKSKCYQIMLNIYDKNRARDYCYKMIARRSRTTISDAASIKIGNKNTIMYFPTLSQRTFTHYKVLEKKDFYAYNLMDYISTFEGTKLNIYRQDKGKDNKIDKVLDNGKYSVYSYDGIIALVKEV